MSFLVYEIINQNNKYFNMHHLQNSIIDIQYSIRTKFNIDGTGDSADI
jgi:hypothetical protein